MTPAEAYHVLQLEPGASRDQIEQQYAEQQRVLREKRAKSPAPGLKAHYQQSLAKLTAARDLLVGRDEAARGLQRRRAEAGEPRAAGAGREAGGNSSVGRKLTPADVDAEIDRLPRRLDRHLEGAFRALAVASGAAIVGIGPVWLWVGRDELVARTGLQIGLLVGWLLLGVGPAVAWWRLVVRRQRQEHWGPLREAMERREAYPIRWRRHGPKAVILLLLLLAIPFGLRRGSGGVIIEENVVRAAEAGALRAADGEASDPPGQPRLEETRSEAAELASDASVADLGRDDWAEKVPAAAGNQLPLAQPPDPVVVPAALTGTPEPIRGPAAAVSPGDLNRENLAGKSPSTRPLDIPPSDGTAPPADPTSPRADSGKTAVSAVDRDRAPKRGEPVGTQVKESDPTGAAAPGSTGPMVASRASEERAGRVASSALPRRPEIAQAERARSRGAEASHARSELAAAYGTWAQALREANAPGLALYALHRAAAEGRSAPAQAAELRREFSARNQLTLTWARGDSAGVGSSAEASPTAEIRTAVQAAVETVLASAPPGLLTVAVTGAGPAAVGSADAVPPGEASPRAPGAARDPQLRLTLTERAEALVADVAWVNSERSGEAVPLLQLTLPRGNAGDLVEWVEREMAGRREALLERLAELAWATIAERRRRARGESVEDEADLAWGWFAVWKEAGLAVPQAQAEQTARRALALPEALAVAETVGVTSR